MSEEQHDADKTDLSENASSHNNATQLAQMTASSTPIADTTVKWACDMCTYENYPQSKKCTMCRSPRPISPTENATALPTEDLGAAAVTERLRPLRISTPPSVEKWSCASCTYENWPRAVKCAMCGAERERPRTERRSHSVDKLFLTACVGVVEDSPALVQAYLDAGGPAARALTASELRRLNRDSAFDVGHTLVHLAIRFQRQEILSMLLSKISGGGPGLKRSPSYVAPDLASVIRRHVASCMRQRKGSLPFRYLNEIATFSLPAETVLLGAAARSSLLSQLVDGEAQLTLATAGAPPCLLALWNRSAGDCLLDAAMQACYGVSDRDGILRAAITQVMRTGEMYYRWSRSERLAGAAGTDESLRQAWTDEIARTAVSRQPLQQIHIFALAQIMRRPIVVYGEDIIRSFRGEPLGYANFQGVYLPLLWDPEHISSDALCVGYTRGHFSALVPVLNRPTSPYICQEQQEDDNEIYLPLIDGEGKLLPLHFLTEEESLDEESVVSRMGVARNITGGRAGMVLRAHTQRPLPVEQMLEEWLNYYRRLDEQSRGPFPPRLQKGQYCSDPDTDEE